METFEELFEATLRDIYYAEKAILKALPRMAKKSFTAHYEETEQQVARLEEIFGGMGKRARGKKCPAIDGIEEGAEIMKEAMDNTVRDAGMLAGRGALRDFPLRHLEGRAEKLGMTDAVGLLDETLQEEKAADEKLTSLADSEINLEAMEGDGEEESGPRKKKRT